jgi:hypothetical protein
VLVDQDADARLGKAAGTSDSADLIERCSGTDVRVEPAASLDPVTELEQCARDEDECCNQADEQGIHG